MIHSLPSGYTALVIGAGGGIGSALMDTLADMPGCARVLGLGRASDPPVDLLDEGSLAAAAARLSAACPDIRLILDATGALAIDGTDPEKSLSALDPGVMARSYAINAIGPALLLKHLAPLLPRKGKSAFATLSARVGSIADNRLGGWYSYRAAKAALNQMVRSAAIEIARSHPEAVCLALHPGTVDTPLTRRYARGRFTHSPARCARNLLAVIDTATPAQSGRFLAYDGQRIPW